MRRNAACVCKRQAALDVFVRRHSIRERHGGSGSSAHGADGFHLEIEGISAARFVRCAGLAASRSVFEYAEGGSRAARKLPGDEVFSNIVLERGVARDRELFEWYAKGDRRDGAVVLLGADGREVLRWAFSRGWPCRWEGPPLDARRAEVALELLDAALELLEITHEGLQCVAR